jgi:hypothetical protein
MESGKPAWEATVVYFGHQAGWPGSEVLRPSRSLTDRSADAWCAATALSSMGYSRTWLSRSRRPGADSIPQSGASAGFPPKRLFEPPASLHGRWSEVAPNHLRETKPSQGTESPDLFGAGKRLFPSLSFKQGRLSYSTSLYAIQVGCVG